MDITFSMAISSAIAIGFGYELGKYLGKLCAGFINGLIRAAYKRLDRGCPKIKNAVQGISACDSLESEPTMRKIGFLQ